MKDGRVVIITGAAGGIGQKIVDRFVTNGDRVIALDRATASLDELVVTRNAGDQLSTACVDITDGSAVDAFAQSVRKTHEHVDMLVNCAGFYPVVSFEQMTPEQWSDVIAINLTGTFRLPTKNRKHQGLPELCSQVGRH